MIRPATTDSLMVRSEKIIAADASGRPRVDRPGDEAPLRCGCDWLAGSEEDVERLSQYPIQFGTSCVVQSADRFGLEPALGTRTGRLLA